MRSFIPYLSVLPGAALAAQTVAPPTAPDLGATPFLTPIRAVATDSDLGGGLWASGANYKVALGESVAFYPVLGEQAPKNLPLRWRTRDIAVGGESVLGPLAAANGHASDWRFELRRGAITEAYDVRNDGVEQTFVLHSRPAQGDLVITGDIDSELVAPASPYQHGDLSFRDSAGKERVRYGAATAIDAVGRRVAMESCYDGRAISLRLCGDWLASATFPVVVDPLLASTTLFSNGSAINGLDVARDDGSNQLMTVYRRASAASDHDGFGYLVGDSPVSGGTTVFSDLDAAWSTRHLSVAFVGGTNKWIIALERSVMGATTAVSSLRYHLHASGDPTPSTAVEYIYTPLGESWTTPDVGGLLASGTGDQALLVFRIEYPFNAPYNSDVYAVLVDTTHGTESALIQLASGPAGTTYDRGSMRVNRESGGASHSWVIAYTEINRTIVDDDIDLFVARVAADGTVSARIAVPSPSPDHKVSPALDGRNGRYLLTHGLRAFGHGNAWSHTIVSRRVDFAEGANVPSFGPAVTLASAGEFFVTDTAFDSVTRSHWVSTYYDSGWNIYATRMGYDGLIDESATVYNSPGAGSSPTVCFNDDARHFHVLYPVVEGAFHIVRARSLVYADTAATVQGSGCGGTINAIDIPYAGHEFFGVGASGLMSNTPAVLLCSAGVANLPLASFGMPGCNLLLAPETLLFTLNTTSNPAGTVQVTLPLPTPIAGLDVYFQWAHFSFGANPAHMLATRRLAVPVR